MPAQLCDSIPSLINGIDMNNPNNYVPLHVTSEYYQSTKSRITVTGGKNNAEVEKNQYDKPITVPSASRALIQRGSVVDSDIRSTKDSSDFLMKELGNAGELSGDWQHKLDKWNKRDLSLILTYNIPYEFIGNSDSEFQEKREKYKAFIQNLRKSQVKKKMLKVNSESESELLRVPVKKTSKSKVIGNSINFKRHPPLQGSLDVETTPNTLNVEEDKTSEKDLFPGLTEEVLTPRLSRRDLSFMKRTGSLPTKQEPTQLSPKMRQSICSRRQSYIMKHVADKIVMNGKTLTNAYTTTSCPKKKVNSVIKGVHTVHVKNEKNIPSKSASNEFGIPGEVLTRRRRRRRSISRQQKKVVLDDISDVLTSAVTSFTSKNEDSFSDLPFCELNTSLDLDTKTEHGVQGNRQRRSSFTFQNPMKLQGNRQRRPSFTFQNPIKLRKFTLKNINTKRLSFSNLKNRLRGVL